jgi:hypothetical protein
MDAQYNQEGQDDDRGNEKRQTASRHNNHLNRQEVLVQRQAALRRRPNTGELRIQQLAVMLAGTG